ncbi:Flap endonuclease GEN-like 1 [Apostasia shenzhenica]|uniref:Flap endonuclease GEN-like 1 n=1 Tax=Apostasia shenzhenica TaxID=1088818 RepID=A0A2I0BF61_9ASPA|nr:Flap endonuclease GEN-like 1 [Apostasia shenzhenica]
MERFLRGSGLELAVLSKQPEAAGGDGSQVARQRNRVFAKWVQECVELLEILGMPILKAQSEAEALCAQLNSDGHVHACITADSDAFLFGANCVIKCLRSNSKEPFECYYLSDIEAGLGLKRKQMIAMALLIGNDYSQGVPGIGVETALRFVKLFSEDVVLDRLGEVGKGYFHAYFGDIVSSLNDDLPAFQEGVVIARSPHCSICGHPGNKRAHEKIACQYCISVGSENCTLKSTGFKCNCSDCIKDCICRDKRKFENWQIKSCNMIAAVENFPNKEITGMYLNANHGIFNGGCDILLRWDRPKVEDLVDFLSFHQHWKPSYVRQRILPMLSTMFLREVASKSVEGLLLCDQYEFHSIDRVKIRYGQPCYLVKWKKAVHCLDNVICSISPTGLESEQTEPTVINESFGSFDDFDVPTVLMEDGCCFLVTEENIELVKAAFPKAVGKLLDEKRLKETESSQRKAMKSKASFRSPESKGDQLSITEFYRSTKVVTFLEPAKSTKKSSEEEDSSSRSQKVPPNLLDQKIPDPLSRSRKVPPNLLDQKIPKSVRRRLLFD